jgi:hypothetical protein
MFRLFFAVFLVQGIINVKADEAPPNRLISEAIPAWRKLKAAEEHMSFTRQSRRWATENGKPLEHWSRHSRSTVVREGPSFLVTAHSQENTGEASIGANPRYLGV